MSRRILHIQSDDSTGTVEAGFRRLGQNPDISGGVAEVAGKLASRANAEVQVGEARSGTRRADALPLAGGGGCGQFLVMDRLSGLYAKWQGRMAQNGGRGVVWLSDDVLSNRLVATKLMRQGFVVFLTVDQALRFTGCGRVRTAVTVLRKDCPGGLVVSDGVTSSASFEDVQELVPLLVRHHADPLTRVEVFFASLAWCLANDVPWQEATKWAQEDAVVGWSMAPVSIAEQTVDASVFQSKRSSRRTAATVSAISVIAGTALLASFAFFG